MDIFDKYGNHIKKYGKLPNTNGSYIYIPLENKKIIDKSLELYNVSNPIKKVYEIFVKIIIKLTHINIFYKEIVYTDFNDNIKQLLLNIEDFKYAAIYTGDNSVDGTYVLQLMDSNENIIGYLKGPNNISAKEYIIKEKNNLEYLKELNLKNGITPDVIFFDDKNTILIESTENNLIESKNKLDDKHIQFLNELYQKTNKVYKFTESKCYYDITKTIDILDGDLKILLQKVLNNILEDENLQQVQFCFSHNDFYSSNIKLTKDKIYVYDWESSKINPIYYDIIHYIFRPFRSKSILSIKNKYSTKKTINFILENKYLIKFENDNNIPKNLRKSNLILYLCELLYEYSIELKRDPKEDINILKCKQLLEELIK